MNLNLEKKSEAINFVLETMFYTYPVQNHNCIIYIRVYVAYSSKILKSERKNA